MLLSDSAVRVSLISPLCTCVRTVCPCAAAKGRLSGLDDASRREQAAQLAYRFAALLDDGESEEDVPSDATDQE